MNDQNTLFEFSPKPVLMIQESARKYRVATPQEVLAAAGAAIDTVYARGQMMNTPEIVGEFLIAKLARYESEVFAVIFMDQKLRMIAYEELFKGSIAESRIYTRTLIQRCLHHNAAMLILAHNHPSGGTDPSMGDQRITTKIKEALSHIDVILQDHIVVGGGEYTSMAKRGLI